MLLQALLIANGVLLFFVIVTAVTRFWSANKDRYHKEMNIDENALKDDSNEIVSEETKEAVNAPTQNIEETVKEEIDNKVEAVVLVEETIKPITEEPETETVEEELIIGDVDAPAKEGSFASKLLSLDLSVQEYYDKINNEFMTYRRIHGRVSKSGVSYRLGRDLIAKITIRGKTMRLNLALDVNDFSEKIYFQKDMRSVKAYQDIPFMVKVKSDRGLVKALQLIEALAVKENIEKKARYFPIDSIENLRNLKK